MKAKKFTPAMRGLAALMTCLMVLSIVGTGVANTYRGALDDTLGTESYVTINDDSAARFRSLFSLTRSFTKTHGFRENFFHAFTLVF